MAVKDNELIMRNSVFGWIALGTGLILLVPLVAMQFTGEVNWKPGDFLVMGLLVFVFASLFVFVSRRFSRRRRPWLGLIVAAAFLYTWAELAAGIFTNAGS